MERYTAYDKFAWFYNQGWTAFSTHIFPLLKELAGDNLPDGAKILDLCCGTGQLAGILTDKGYKVTGIDGSANQIKYARKNAPKAKFIIADARDFKLPAIYDAAFCTFDSLNHIMTLPDLYKVYKNVYKSLKKGGIFIFDLTTDYFFNKYIQNYKAIEDKTTYFYTNQAEYDAAKRVANLKFTMFQQTGKGWRRYDILLQQRPYRAAEARSALRMALFKNISVVAATPERGLHKPEKNSLRLFYYAEKP